MFRRSKTSNGYDSQGTPDIQEWSFGVCGSSRDTRCRCTFDRVLSHRDAPIKTNPIASYPHLSVSSTYRLGNSYRSEERNRMVEARVEGKSGVCDPVGRKHEKGVPAAMAAIGAAISSIPLLRITKRPNRSLLFLPVAFLDAISRSDIVGPSPRPFLNKYVPQPSILQ